MVGSCLFLCLFLGKRNNDNMLVKEFWMPFAPLGWDDLPKCIAPCNRDFISDDLLNGFNF